VTGALPASGRLDYLDWLRGISVLVMIEAHTFDAWTVPAEKSREAYAHLMVLGGFASPLFLFLAGVAAALAASSQMARGRTPRESAWRVERRGLEILLLAFLFRLQSFALGGFTHAPGLLKVDILNVMGPSIVATAAFWRLPVSRRLRAAALAAVTVAIALATPSLRQAGWVDTLPGPIAAYLDPPAGGAFTLLPWSAFVSAGAVLGIALDAWRGASGWKLHLGIALAGAALALGSWWASWQPAVFEGASFWSTSPAFFGLRAGLLTLAVALAWLWGLRAPPGRPGPIQRLGIGSLFVYWVHVELVYGLPGRPLRGRLTLEECAVAFAALTVLMYVLLLGWQRLRGGPSRDRSGFLRLRLQRV
jgi:uncharacterized membrane protein